MKHLYKTAISLAIAVSLGLFYGNAVGGGVGNGDLSGDGLDPSHLELFLDDLDDREMGSEALNPEVIESNGTNQSDDALWDDEESRLQDGAHAGGGVIDETGDDSGESSVYLYKYQRAQFRQGAAVNENLNAEQTQTTFRAEISTPSAKNEEGAIKLYQGDRIRIASELMVDDNDVGQSAQCMVVAQYKPKAGEGELSSFMLSEQGWEEWKGSLSELTGVQCELGENYRIMAHDNEIFPGEFHFYFAYQLDNGKIVHSTGPLSFTVE